jgi:hypothetical protein
VRCGAGQLHPLILIGIWVVFFLEIHPLNALAEQVRRLGRKMEREVFAPAASAPSKSR